MSNNTENINTGPESTPRISIYTPLIYLGILITSLIIFSALYRRRSIRKLASMKPWFETTSNSRDIYFVLRDETKPKPHDKVLKAALIRRGSEALRQSFKQREQAPMIQILYQNGSIGDELWNRFQNAMKLIDLEVKECILEAESYKKGWAESFFKTCGEVTFNEAYRRRITGLTDKQNFIKEDWGL